MSQVFVWVAFIFNLLESLQIPFLVDAFRTLENAWSQLVQTIIPIRNFHGFSLSQAFYFIMLGILIVEIYQKGRGRLSNLDLKKIALEYEGKLLGLQSKSESSASVGTYDFIQDISYIQSKHNSGLTIALVMLAIIAPGVYLASQTRTNGVYFLIIAVIISLVALYYLLKGTVEVGTADGSITSLNASKDKAHAIFETLTGSAPSEFIRVELSGIFTERLVYFRRGRVTGMVEISRFPWVWAILTVGALIMAIVANTNLPKRVSPNYGYYLAPLILLIITIVLAMIKRRFVKLIGLHLYPLGNHGSVEGILSEVTPVKE